MSTASGITVKTGENEYKHVYNHCDGDLHGAGKTLINHYNKILRVKELVEQGNISLLRPHIHPDPDKPHGWNDFEYKQIQSDTCRFYKRDREDEGEDDAEVFESIDEVHNYEYNYYFDGKEWLFREENNKGWLSLSQALKEEGII